MSVNNCMSGLGRVRFSGICLTKPLSVGAYLLFMALFHCRASSTVAVEIRPEIAPRNVWRPWKMENIVSRSFSFVTSVKLGKVWTRWRPLDALYLKFLCMLTTVTLSRKHKLFVIECKDNICVVTCKSKDVNLDGMHSFFSRSRRLKIRPEIAPRNVWRAWKMENIVSRSFSFVTSVKLGKVWTRWRPLDALYLKFLCMLTTVTLSRKHKLFVIECKDNICVVTCKSKDVNLDGMHSFFSRSRRLKNAQQLIFDFWTQPPLPPNLVLCKASLFISVLFHLIISVWLFVLINLSVHPT